MFDLDFRFNLRATRGNALGFEAGLVSCLPVRPRPQSWGTLMATVPLGTRDAASSEVAVSVSEEANGLRQARIWFFGLSCRWCCP